MRNTSGHEHIHDILGSFAFGFITMDKKVSLKFIMHPHGNSFNFLWLIKHEYVKSVFSLCRCSGVLVLVCLFVCLFVYWCY